MKITFIKPHITNSRSKDAMEPLAISALAALTPDRFEREFFDERLEELPDRLDTDLVAISVDSFAARRSYHLASVYRKQGIKVIMGGYHPTLLPDEVREYCDCVVVGEAEPVWKTVLDDFTKGKLRPIYRAAINYDASRIVYDETIFKGKKYVPVTPVQAGRGCKFNCDFCSVCAFYNNNYKLRPVEQVIAEIKRRKPKFMALVDDNIFLEKEYTRELLEALRPLKIKWGTQVSLDIAGQEELLSLMAKSGCISVTLGFESLHPENLRMMNKKINLQVDYSEAVARIKAHGIMVYGSFVFGYDHDTTDSFGKALDFALDNNLFLANFNPLIPHPGTKLYKRLQEENRLLYENWWNDSSYKYGNAFFTPRKMEPGELKKGCYRIRRQFNSYRNIFKRALDLKANCKNAASLLVFLAGNLISRQEIYKKQGITLGDNR